MPKSPFNSNPLEYAIEWCIYQSRWLQVPIYLAMCVVMLVYSYVFCKETVHLVWHAHALTEDTMLFTAISLVDVSMVINLLWVVVVGGYRSYVSQLEVTQQSRDKDAFRYLEKITPNTLKHKLIISLISISAVHLLETFVSKSINPERALIQMGIHLVFLLSALAISYMDRHDKHH